MWLARALVGRWRWMTLAALFSCAITLRLGFWQLDRLAQRREINVQLAQRAVAEPLRLPGPVSQRALSAEDLHTLEFLPVVLRGDWDVTKERGLPNQFWEGQLGLHIVTPFVLETGDKAVLIDRGWIPAASAGGDWVHYRPTPTRAGGAGGPVEVRGFVRLEPRGGPLGDLRRAAERDGFDLLPFYVAEAPAAPDGGSGQALPYKRPPATSIGEGVHAIAAAQWFIISAIIVAGLVIYVAQRERPRATTTWRGGSRSR